VGTLNAPTSFAEYDPNTNAFTLISGPTGQTDGGAPYNTRLLDLPDGSVLFSNGGSRLYTYRPSGAPIAAARPSVSSVLKNQDGSYVVTGYLLTGISEGSEYGDDAQEATNYPIVRLTASNGNVYYGRTTNWSTTGVAKGGAIQSAKFTTPAGLPSGAYQLQVVTNGVASYSVPFDSTVIYNYVGTEGQTFSFGNPADLAFGASGSYAYRYAKTGNITYNTATFGDPLFGFAKFGFYKWFTQSVAENNSATFNIPVEAAYGGNGNFLYKYGVSGTVTFSNAAFGSDPAPNVAKNGFYMPYTQCAVENETLAFNIPTDLAYGANGKFNFKHAFTGTITFNNAAFGDPISGIAKAGYFRPAH
ncbi:MAG: hypothetical protein ABIZ35_04255, partial [Capsulimonas sp.]